MDERGRRFMRKMFVFFVIGILTLSLSCAKKEEGGLPTEGGTITGKVTLEDAKDFSGVTVSIDVLGVSTTTKADGSFVLSNIPDGIYTVIFLKEGWSTITQDVSVETGKTATVSIFIPKPLTIKGKVITPGGDPVPGVMVKVEGTDLSGVSKDDGSFEIPGVSPGTYSLLIQGSAIEGYEDVKLEGVEVVAGEFPDLGEIPLKPKPKEVTELAIYWPNVGNWMGATAMQGVVDTITTKFKRPKPDMIKVFREGEGAQLADWMKKRIKDGKGDIVIFMDMLPTEVYPQQNAAPDGSVVEDWLENGNAVLYTGDYAFYLTSQSPRIENGENGIRYVLDEPGLDCWTDGSSQQATADGLKYLPSIPASYGSSRAIKLGQLTNWEPACIFAVDGSNQADCVVLKNKNYPGSYFFQFGMVVNDNLPRGPVLLEFIQNWLLKQKGYS